MGKATRAALSAFVSSEMDKKLKQKQFDDEYYIDVASGEVKKRIYNNRRGRQPRKITEAEE